MRDEDPRPLSVQRDEQRQTVTRKLAKLVHEALLEEPDTQWKVSARLTLARYEEIRKTWAK